MAEASGLFSATLTPCFNSLNKTIPFSHFQSHSYPIIFLKRPIHCLLSTSDTAKSTVSQTVPWGCDIDSLENASALQQWLSESGLPPQKMAIQKVEVGERGLVASKNIRKGEKLLFVPPSLVITADSVRFSRRSLWKVAQRSITFFEL